MLPCAKGLQAEGFHALDVTDVAGDVVGADLVQVFLKVRTDFAVLGGVATGKLNVALAFHLQDQGGPALHGSLGLLNIDHIFAFAIASEGTVVLQVVEAHHVCNAVGLGGTKAHTAQNASDEGDKGVLLDAVSDFAHLNQAGGEEQTAEIEFLKSLPKKSLHMYRAMCGSDTVSLLDLNPEVGESFVVGESSIVKVRPIRSLRVLYWELPSASRAYCFENDTIWFSRDDTSPKYLLMDDGVVIKRAQKQIIDGVEVWKYDDGNEIKAMNINWSHNQDSLSVGQNGNLSLYNNLQFENGVCYKTLNVSFLSFGKNPLNGQFSKGLSQIFKKKNDIPTSSISFSMSPIFSSRSVLESRTTLDAGMT